MTSDVLPTGMPPELAINTNFLEVLHLESISVRRRWAHGPSGIGVSITAVSGHHGSIIVTQSDNPATPGMDWLHASLAWDGFMPTYGDLRVLHHAVFGRKRYAYQVFAPEAQHISGSNDRDGLPGHEFALHLWGRADGKPVLPEFGSYFGRV